MSVLCQWFVPTNLNDRTLLIQPSLEIRDMWGKIGSEESEEKTATVDT